MEANQTKEKDLVIAYMIYQSINSQFLSRLETTNGKYDLSVVSEAGLIILKKFVEKFLNMDPDELIKITRFEIAKRMDVAPTEIPHSDEILLRIKLGEIFYDGAPLLRAMED